MALVLALVLACNDTNGMVNIDAAMIIMLGFIFISLQNIEFL
ncbi:hypothetical protein XBFM1_1260010 [Xenorhabdus bovienii str. feltiae Moldova]|uniref:Uncharacterized protein n=1 Tax=Xenorhabdus bovienii str. feltiae Moldova TaxID=1398200 RepID=A0A077NQ96_XENBV|nr:hypothetical protein XBFM1_1260010 [Xenorhabdus bovienii str. feltiae Moldova]